MANCPFSLCEFQHGVALSFPLLAPGLFTHAGYVRSSLPSTLVVGTIGAIDVTFSTSQGAIDVTLCESGFVDGHWGVQLPMSCIAGICCCCCLLLWCLVE